MNPIGNKMLTMPIQTADALSETGQASSAQQSPKAATSESIGKAMSNFNLMKAGSADVQKELQQFQPQPQGTQDSGFFGQVGSFLQGADAKVLQNPDGLGQIKATLDGAAKDLQSQDKMGNFEIQRLMSDFNEAETLASSVLKKKDDATNSIIGKL